MSAAPDASSPRPHEVLYSTPVSNFSARCRYVIYRKNLPVDIRAPEGGAKTEHYLANFHPLGKVPSMALPDGRALYESEVINEYLVATYTHNPPALIPHTPYNAARCRLLSRIHDLYCAPYQPALYKSYPTPEARAADLALLRKGLDTLEREWSETGPYALGNDVSLADAAVFPSCVFYEFMMPRFFGESFETGRPKLAKWYEYMKHESEAAKNVYTEIWGALVGWEESGRWEKLGIKKVA